MLRMHESTGRRPGRRLDDDFKAQAIRVSLTGASQWARWPATST